MAKNKETINLMPTKPKVFLPKTKIKHKINFSKLQVKKQVTSRISLGNGSNCSKVLLQFDSLTITLKKFENL